MATLEAAFRAADIDENGNLDASELQNAFRAAGRPSDPETIQKAIKALDADGDGLISLSEFKAIAWKLSKRDMARDMNGKLMTKNNVSKMDDNRRTLASAASFKHVQQDWDVEEVEAALSAAATESMRVVADERPGYIALTLLGLPMPSTEVEYLQSAPADLDGEIAALSETLRDAVNSAVRGNPSHGTPLQRIAAFLIELDQEVEWTEPLPDAATSALLAEGKQAAASGAPRGLHALEAAERRKMAKEAAKEPPNVVQLAIAKALATRGQQPNRLQAHAERAADTPEAKANAVAAGKHSAEKQQRKATRRRVPVLGREAAVVLPFVIGTFQDYSSKRAARIVSDDVISKSEAAKPDKLRWQDYEDEVSNEDRALRALGLMSSTKILLAKQGSSGAAGPSKASMPTHEE